MRAARCVCCKSIRTNAIVACALSWRCLTSARCVTALDKIRTLALWRVFRLLSGAKVTAHGLRRDQAFDGAATRVAVIGKWCTARWALGMPKQVLVEAHLTAHVALVALDWRLHYLEAYRAVELFWGLLRENVRVQSHQNFPFRKFWGVRTRPRPSTDRKTRRWTVDEWVSYGPSS